MYTKSLATEQPMQLNPLEHMGCLAWVIMTRYFFQQLKVQ